VARIRIDPRVIHVERGWWFPEAAAPDYGILSNVNLLTNNPPYDRRWEQGLLCRVSAAA